MKFSEKEAACTHPKYDPWTAPNANAINCYAYLPVVPSAELQVDEVC